MKYKILNVKVTENVPYIKGGFLKGTRYDVEYEVDGWSWCRFKIVSKPKKAFRLPVGICFRDSETGEIVPSAENQFIDAYIAVQNL